MGVYIKGMEIPKKCSGCVMRVDDPDFGMCCGVTGCDIDMVTFCSCKLSNCPLVEVKTPHGRLADVSEDATYDARYDHFDDHHMIVAQQMLDDLPTIIEAEGKDDG